MGGRGRKNPKSIHFYKHAHTYIHYFHTCDKILNFTNGLQVFIVDTFDCSFRWQSHGYRFHLSFHNSKMSYSSSIIFDHNFDPSANHCCPCSTHLQTTTLARSKSLGQHQACLSKVFPIISNTDPMVVIIAHCLIDLTWQNGKVLDSVYRYVA